MNQNNDNTIYPFGWVDPLAVPSQISSAQLRKALSYFNVRGTVEAAVAASTQDTKDWYEYGTYFSRYHPEIQKMTTALNLPEELLDSIWRYGDTLV